MLSVTFFSLAILASCALSQSKTSSAVSPTASLPGNITLCIINCVVPAAQAAGCDFADPTCLCKSTKFQEQAATCLQNNCTSADILTALAVQAQQCGTVTVSASESSTSYSASHTIKSRSFTSSATIKSPTTTRGAVPATSAASTKSTSSITSASKTSSAMNASPLSREATNTANSPGTTNAEILSPTTTKGPTTKGPLTATRATSITSSTIARPSATSRVASTTHTPSKAPTAPRTTTRNAAACREGNLRLVGLMIVGAIGMLL